MAIQVGPVPQWEWKPLPMRGCHDVEARVLLRGPDFVIVLARFRRGGSIAEHSSRYPIDVVCLEGSGNTSVRHGLETESTELRAGQTVRWPAEALHRLWTGEEQMLALLVERVGEQLRKEAIGGEKDAPA